MPLALIIALALIAATTAITTSTLLTLRHRRHKIHTTNTRVRERLRQRPREFSRECPFCGLVADAFDPFGEPERLNARCPRCGSLERHRLAWLYLINETDLLSRGGRRRVLHLAPEVASWARLSQLPRIEFVSPDDPSSDLPELKADALPFEDERFDVVICGHAFGLAPDRDRAALELARVLPPGGWAVVQIPQRTADPAPVPGKTSANAARALADAGFEVTIDPYPRRIGRACANRFALPVNEDIVFARRSAGAGKVERLWTGARDIAATSPVPGAVAPYRGRVEQVRDGVVTGWVWSPERPARRVHVRMIVSGRAVAGGWARRERRSLADRGIGDGQYAFQIRLPDSLAARRAHDLRVEPEGGIALPPASSYRTSADRDREKWGQARFAVHGFAPGRVEHVRGGVVSGWVWSGEYPDWRHRVRVLLDGVEVGRAVAELPRGSVSDGASEDRRLGFRFRLPDKLANPGVHTVRVEVAGAGLPPAASFATTTAPEDDAAEVVGEGVVAGRIERLHDGVVHGWAWNPAAPRWRVGVRLLLDGREVAGDTAALHRPSLAEAGIGDGRHGFRVALPASATNGRGHTLRVEADGIPLAAASAFSAPQRDGAEQDQTTISIPDPVAGRVERVAAGVVTGWAWRPAELNHRVEVRVIVDGREVAGTVAGLEHAALLEAGVGDGRHGFRAELPAELADGGRHDLLVKADGSVLLPASAAFVSAAGREAGPWVGTEFVVPGAVIGRVELAADGIVGGWAYRAGAPSWRVWVRVIVDGLEVAAGAAQLHRTALADAGIGDGLHGFRFAVPGALLDGARHRVRVEAEGVTLPATASFETEAPAQPGLWEHAEFVIDGSAAAPDGRPSVIGRIETADAVAVTGWAFSPEAPTWRVWVRVVIDGEEAGGAVADGYRKDLADARIGDGHCGFTIALADLPARTEPARHLRVEAAGGTTLPPGPGVNDDDTGRGFLVEVSPARCR